MVGTTYSVLSRTYQSFKDIPNPTSFQKELKIIQSKADLENPPEVVKAELVQHESSN